MDSGRALLVRVSWLLIVFIAFALHFYVFFVRLAPLSDISPTAALPCVPLAPVLLASSLVHCLFDPLGVFCILQPTTDKVYTYRPPLSLCVFVLPNFVVASVVSHYLILRFLRYGFGASQHIQHRPDPVNDHMQLRWLIDRLGHDLH